MSQPLSIPASLRKPFWMAGLCFILVLLGAFAIRQPVLLIIPFALLFLFIFRDDIRPLFFLLLFLIPLSIEYQFTASLGTDFPDEFIMMLLTAIFFFYAIYRPAAIGKKVWNHPLFLLILIHWIWIGISAGFSTNPPLSVKFWLAKIWYIVPFVLLPQVFIRNPKDLRRAMACLIAALLLVALQSFIRHGQKGFSFIGINDSVAPFFRNHVNYSAMLVAALPVMWAALLLTPKGTKRRKYYVWITAVLLVALLLAYSRGAWLALITGGIAWWAIKRRLLISLFVAGLALVMLAAAWLSSGNRYLKFAHDYNTTVFHEDFSAHLRATYQMKDVSTAERFYRWVAGARMLDEFPATGFGPNTFYTHYKRYEVPAFRTWVSGNPEHSTAHNYYLLTAIEQGLTGLLLFLALVFGLLYAAQYLSHKARDPFYRTTARAAGAVLAMLCTLNFLSDLVETDKLGSLFFLCAGILIWVSTRQEEAASL